MIRLFSATCISVCFLIGTGLHAQTNTKINFTCKDSIAGWLSKNHIPLAAIGIIEDNTIKTTTAFDSTGENPGLVNTLFNVASLTKPVVAITVLKLVQAGWLKLDEPLSEYWIDPDIMNDPRTQKLSARILLSHQSGFANWRQQTDSHKLSFQFEPGTKFGYSGEGFEYLRHAVEHKSGKTLQQLSDSLLFRPLGLHNTQYSWSSALDSTRYASPHGKNGELLIREKRTSICAADWLVTTIRDYSAFGVYVLKGAGLSGKLFTEMSTPQVRLDGSPIETMGLGWEVIQHLPNEEYILTHTGHDDGVTTLIILLPKSKRGIVLLTNGDKGFDVISMIVKSMLGIKQLDPYLNDL